MDRPTETNMSMAVAADKALEAAQQARIQRRDVRAVGGATGGQYCS